MKKILFVTWLSWFMPASLPAQPDTPENPGDNFSLEAALDLFKTSASLEEFEKALNTESNQINNLDLNHDGKTDYLAVSEIADGNHKAIVISALIATGDKQDVAVIGLERTGKEEAGLQIQGDDTLYADNTIIEPYDEKQETGNTKGGPSGIELSIMPIVVNVWTWPIVRTMFAPSYIIWASPYKWAFYPKWWRPWHPVARTIYVARYAPRKIYYRVAPLRVVSARKIYAPRRNVSNIIVHKKPRIAVVKSKPVRVKKVGYARKKARIN